MLLRVEHETPNLARGMLKPNVAPLEVVTLERNKDNNDDNNNQGTHCQNNHNSNNTGNNKNVREPEEAVLVLSRCYIWEQ